MKHFVLTLAAILTVTVFLDASTSAQEATPPLTAADREAFYKDLLEKRVAAILNDLALNDSAKSSQVHDLLTAQYRALKDRDEAVAAKRKALGKEVIGTDKDPAVEARSQTRTLHDQFIARLSTLLTPAQVEKIKDLMTYNKVRFTYDAYGQIVPRLTDQAKARILELLKQAREEAMDGGSASEKSAIFQKYKDKINEYLTAQGYDVVQAYKDWNTKQELARKQKDESVQQDAKPAQ